MGESRFFPADGRHAPIAPRQSDDAWYDTGWPPDPPANGPGQGGTVPDPYDRWPRAGDAAPDPSPRRPGPGGATHHPPGRQGPPTGAALLHGLGAVLSLVLLVVGVAWTWQVMQRDVSGVPVVRALEGPARVPPDDPGGTQADFQGLAVNELAADGPSDASGQIVLAPEPMGLDAQSSSATGTDTDVPRPDAARTPLDVALRVPETSQTATDDTSDPAQPDADAAPSALGFVQPNAMAVDRSPRPAPRGQTRQPAAAPAQPQDTAPVLASAVAESVAAGLATRGGIDVDPATLGPGTRLVQLGIYDSRSAARDAWDRLAQRYSPALDGRGRVIEAAHSGGSVYYRLRAHGFADADEVRQLCVALVDARLECTPVLIR